MSEKPAESLRRKWIEPVVAVLMALTTLGTAWCSYESAAWTRAQQPAHERIQCAGAKRSAARCAGQPGADRSHLDVHAAPRCAARRQRTARELLCRAFSARCEEGLRSMARVEAIRESRRRRAPICAEPLPGPRRRGSDDS